MPSNNARLNKGNTMTQVATQKMIITEVCVNAMAYLRKGQTIKARQERSKARWVETLVQKGYTQSEAGMIWQDAYDVAMLELKAV